MNNNPNRCGSSKKRTMEAITRSTSVAVLITLGLALAVGAAEPVSVRSDRPGPLLAEYLAEGGLPERIVYLARPHINGWHAYNTFGGIAGPAMVPDSQLRSRNLRTGEDRLILSDADGTIRNPCVHYDGQRILFSYRPGKTTYYNLYEIQADGTGLRQITRGPYHDVEPCYLPDGGIAFASSRARRWVPCFITPVGLIYRCNADGGDMRMLTFNSDHDMRPQVLSDGRIMFARWEYIDRLENGEWELWAMRPDGSGQAKLFSNHLMSARQIPGVNKLMTVSGFKNDETRQGPLVTLDLGFSPDDGATVRVTHRAHGGMMTIWQRDMALFQVPPPNAKGRTPLGRVVQNVVPDGTAAPQLLTLSLHAEGRTRPQRSDDATRDENDLLPPGTHQANPQPFDPCPVSPRWAFFCSPRGLWLLRRSDTERPASWELLVKAPKPDVADSRSERPVLCHEPEILAPRRREPVLSPVTDWNQTTGRLYILDVNQRRPEHNPPLPDRRTQSAATATSDNPGLAPGEITAIAVYEILPVPRKWGMHTSPNLSLGSTWSLKRYLGTFQIEPDGSAYVEIPARRMVQFIGLDKHGNGIKRMHAGMNVMPGETLGCMGCHEPRQRTALPAGMPRAMTRPAQCLAVEPGLPADGIPDYFRLVQPIFDRHCIRCHNADSWTGGLDLSSHRGALYVHGAYLLRWRGLVSLPGDQGEDLPYPRSMGSAASPLLKHLSQPHQGVKLTPEEYRRIQIWIDGAGLYSSLNASMDTGPISLPPAFKKVWNELGCTACHSKSELFKRKPGNKHGAGRNFSEIQTAGGDAAVDLTQIEKSLMLRAPLAKESGGLGWCRNADGKPVFATTQDPGYQTLRKSLPAADANGMVAINSVERPGFQPNKGYFGIMRTFGALPKDAPEPTDAQGLQALEEAYYQLFDPGPGADDSGMKHLESGTVKKQQDIPDRGLSTPGQDQLRQTPPNERSNP